MPYINGVYMATPGVSISVNDSNFTAQNAGQGLGVILIGPAVDGQPKTPISIPNAAAALTMLKGGDLLQAVLNVFAGASAIGQVPSQVIVFRPEQATQGTSTIADSSGTAQIALTTTLYGQVANQARWQVTAASGGVGYKVSQALDYTGPGGQTYNTIPQDNINLPVLSLYYTGTGTTPTVSVTDSNLTITATSGGTQTTLANITLTSDMTVQALANQLNQVSGLTVAVLDTNPNDTVAAFFDNVSNVAVSTSASSPTVLYANVTAVVRWFNKVNGYFTAVRQAGATSLATSNTWTYATGGATPTASNSDWQACYTLAQSLTGLFLIQPVSPSYTLWAMNDAHCGYMASLGQPRRGYVGDVAGQTITTELQQVQNINSSRTSIVWPEQQEVDYNGQQVTMAPYLVASYVMGMRAAAPPYQALTNQAVPSNGIGQQVSPSMVAQGVQGGLCMIAPNQTGQIVVIRDRTTWLQNTAYDKVENSTGLVVDIITSDLNQTLLSYIGQAMSAATVGSASAKILSRLTYWYNLGYLSTKPSASDISLSGSGDAITGTVTLYPDVPTNYVVITLNPQATTVAA
ncbi:hypothetical protein [Alicyclobacillus sendaiensis]|uniref:hypothetical protein n=1 Tax=Alicyclobacillus sendaiensis TaxID=192387 RepID=UPI0026F44117|nr:hypothetical protein [Alicyclobacillus sendaiensis]